MKWFIIWLVALIVVCAFNYAAHKNDPSEY